MKSIIPVQDTVAWLLVSDTAVKGVDSPCIVHFYISSVSKHPAEDVLVLVRHGDHVSTGTASALLGNVLEANRHVVQNSLFLMPSIQHEIVLHHKQDLGT